jgi:hypothetical protein
VLRDEENELLSILYAHAVHRKEMYERETSDFSAKMRYEEPGRIYELT